MTQRTGHITPQNTQSRPLTYIHKKLKWNTLIRLASSLVSFFLTAPALTTFTPGSQSLAQWEPAFGDRFIADTAENVGYLVHRNGHFTAFPIATGQRRVVRYIGLTYDATTPEGEWMAKSRHIKGDRITYGPTGRFIRLYKDNDFTHYGIHTYAYEDEFLGGEDRFKSMGCIVASERVFDIIEKTYYMNGKYLDVTTKYGVEGTSVAFNN